MFVLNVRYILNSQFNSLLSGRIASIKNIQILYIHIQTSWNDYKAVFFISRLAFLNAAIQLNVNEKKKAIFKQLNYLT